MVTGVAIADVGPTSVLLYFGCAISPGTTTNTVGGAGLLRQDGTDSESQLYTLNNNGSAMYAGSMFITEECDSVSSAWKVGHCVLNEILALCVVMLVVFT